MEEVFITYQLPSEIGYVNVLFTTIETFGNCNHSAHVRLAAPQCNYPLLNNTFHCNSALLGLQRNGWCGQQSAMVDTLSFIHHTCSLLVLLCKVELKRVGIGIVIFAPVYP